MGELTAYLTPAAFLAFACFRFTMSGGLRGDMVQRYICGFAACSGLALLINAPPTIAALHEVVATEPVILLSRALKTYSLTMLALLAVALSTGGAENRRARLLRQHRAGLAVQAVAALLFWAAGVTITDDAVVIDGSRGLFAVYNALFVLYGCGCLLLLLAALTRHARTAAPRQLRVGLRLLTAGVAIGVVWTGWGLTDISSVLTTGSQPRGEHPVATLLSLAVAVCTLAGTSAVLWGRLLSAPFRWLRARRRFRALEPLWQAIHRELPEIALAGEPARRGSELRSAEFALYRRIIEIRDGHLALRPYFHPEVPGWVASADSGGGGGGGGGGSANGAAQAEDPVLEAANIAAALMNRRGAVEPPAGPPPAVPAAPAPAGPMGQAERGTVDAEVAWLLAVTDAFTRSPAVAEVRRRLRTPAEDLP